MTATPAIYHGYIAMSLDGFIADPQGSVGWLDPFNAAMAEAGDDGGYGDFIEGIDALLMGRETHQQVLGWGWPYGERPGYVLTRQPQYDADHVAAHGDMAELATAIASAGHRNIWILGGGVAQRLALDAGLFDQLRVFIMPVILGGGRPVFAPGATQKISLAGVTERPGGIVELTYRFKE